MRQIDHFVGGKAEVFFELYDLEDVKTAEREKIENISISAELLPFVNVLCDVRKLVLLSGLVTSDEMSNLYCMVNLKYLHVNYQNVDGEKCYQVDVSKLPSLEYLSSDHSENFCNLNKSNVKVTNQKFG